MTWGVCAHRSSIFCNGYQQTIQEVKYSVSCCFRHTIWALGSGWSTRNYRFKRWFWWPAWIQSTVRSFTIVLPVFMLKAEMVIWTHAGQQNRFLDRHVRTAPEEPKAHMYCKKTKKLKIVLLDPSWIIARNTQKIDKKLFGPMQGDKILILSNIYQFFDIRFNRNKCLTPCKIQ